MFIMVVMFTFYIVVPTSEEERSTFSENDRDKIHFNIYTEMEILKWTKSSNLEIVRLREKEEDTRD